MRLDQFSGIVAFLKVAETKNFTRAAIELGVAPPSLSEAIKALELRLGVRLLNRTTRSVGLTEAGSAYLERVRPAAAEIQAAGDALKETNDRVAGTLRLNLPWIAGPLLVEPLMEAFLEAYPDIVLDLVFDDQFVDLAAGGFDAGVRIGTLLEKDMIAVPISAPLTNTVLASPSYLARHGAPKSPADLSGHRCIGYRFASTRRVAAWEFVVDGREIEFLPDPCIAANTMVFVVEAAVRGLGLAFTTEQLAAPRLRDGTLVKVLDTFCATYDPLYIYYSSRRLIAPKLKAFVDFTRSAMRSKSM